MPENFTININAPELFGGEDSEGGIVGPVNVLMGGPDQVAPVSMTSVMPGPLPGFRGALTMFFNGLIAVNNPYPKPWAWRVRRWQSGWDGECWYPEKALIRLGDLETEGPNAIKAMNPIHILYEAATNRDWGRGLDRSRIDDARFRAMADALYDEKMGMCLAYKRRSRLPDFVKEVVNHVGMSLYVDRRTGLLSGTLIRGDYDPEDVPTFDYSNGLLSVEDGDTAAQGEAQISEIIVKYFDPRDRKAHSVRAHNLALFQAAGVSNSETKEYAGFPTAELALLAAHRDLKMYASGLKKLKVTLDRRGYLNPGDVFAISAPDRGIERLILRAGRVVDGQRGRGEIAVQAIQDVFGLPTTVFADEQTSGWVPPNVSALPLDYRRVMETTYRQMVLRLNPADLQAVDSTTGAVVAIGGRPSSLAHGFFIATKAEGEPEYTATKLASFCPVASIPDAVNAYETTFSIEPISDLDLVVVGGACMIENEIMRIDELDLVANTITVGRGCEDTLPSFHPADAVIWFTDVGASSDGREFVNGEVVSVKMLTKTSAEVLMPDDAPTNALEIRRRHYRPLPPAGLTINGEPFSVTTAATGDVVLTWAHRNRLVQMDQLVDHTAPSVTPEAGTLYNVRVYEGEAMIRQQTNIDGTTWTYTTAMQASDGSPEEVAIELESTRGGLTSLQRYRVTLSLS